MIIQKFDIIKIYPEVYGHPDLPSCLFSSTFSWKTLKSLEILRHLFIVWFMFNKENPNVEIRSACCLEKKLEFS
jgi:hypothetical protein